MPRSKSKTAIFVMPATSKAWVGAEGLWVTAAGWAEAAKRVFGESIVITQDRVASAEEVLDYPLVKGNTEHQNSKFFELIPSFVRILLKDFREWRNSKNWTIFNRLEYQQGDVAFVWEKHDLFSGSGMKLARKYKVPYISYVHAGVVWEAEKWGVKRYFWGNFLEKREASTLKKSDVVAVVSKEVKEKIIQMGVPKEKILVSPMAVDPFFYKVSKQEALKFKKHLGIEGKFVIGWTGSFRGFHGLEQIIFGFQEVIRKYPDTVLLLVGDGKERVAVETLVRNLGIQANVIFTGKKPYKEIPLYISIFNLGVAGAKTAVNFHYSPQKIRDYMAAGIPVLAPDAGEVSCIFQDGVNLKLFQVGDIDSIRDQFLFFIENMDKGRKIAEAGRIFVLNKGTWDYELERCLKFLNTRKFISTN